MLDFRRLRNLLALSDERHFARAAGRVHLSQPAFSRSIQALERDFGMRLFDREAGRVTPTEAGEFLIARAHQLLFDARGLERDARLYAASQLGDIAFGVGPFPAATLMMLVLPQLRRRYPGVGLRVEVSNWQLLLERLLAEDIEFFVSDVRDLPANPKISVGSLGRQAARLYARREHPLAGFPCRFHEVWEFGMAATKLPASVRAALSRLRGLAPGETSTPALECDDVALLRALAMSTNTVIAVTDAAVRSDVASGFLVQLEVAGLPEFFSEMGVVTLRNRTASPMARSAIDCIQQVARDVNAPFAKPERPAARKKRRR